MIRAEIVGNSCCFQGGTASGVLDLCRQLVAAGHDPTTPLEAYRADQLALKISSIGYGSRLEVAGNGVGFTVRKGRASSMTHLGDEATLVPDELQDAVALPTMAEADVV